MSRRHTQRELFESGYVQEWIWAYSKAKKLVRYVFLAIGRHARRSRSGEFETPPLSVDAIREATDLGDTAVRECIRMLEELGELDVLKETQRGRVQRYRLRRQLDLLMDVSEPTRHRRAATVPPSRGDGAHHHAATVPPAPGDGEVRVVSFSSDVRTEVPVPTATTEEHAAVAAFLAWVRSVFPVYFAGSSTAMGPLQFEAVLELLRSGRTIARLKLMAVALWRIPATDADTWLTKSDRGLLVLKHRADRLDRIVGEQTDAWRACPHTPHCDFDCLPECPHAEPCAAASADTCRYLQQLEGAEQTAAGARA